MLLGFGNEEWDRIFIGLVGLEFRFKWMISMFGFSFLVLIEILNILFG